MAAIENIVAWATDERARLAHQLDQLQSGRLLIVEKHAHPPGWLEIDTTAQAIEQCREYISELSAIIARYPAVVPTAPAAPPVPRFIPPVLPPPSADADRLSHSEAHPDWVTGWGVVRGQPPRWQFIGIYPTHAEANEAAAEAGEGYYARWGNYNEGRNEFTSGPQFDRAETL